MALGRWQAIHRRPSSSKAMPSGMCRGMWTTRSKAPAEPSGRMAMRAMPFPKVSTK